MSPILDIQFRLRELGRIRMGKKGAKGAPQKLSHWRLTSASRELLESAAEKYGGEVTVWEGAPNEGEHFELLTTSASLDVVIPPNDTAFSQWMELWSGGGCQKRCDGQRQVLVDRPCSCPKDPAERKELAKQGKACKETTRFNVLLPDIQDVGVWRLESHGYYAAVELAGFQQLAQLATSQGQMIRAKLRIDQRTSKVIENGKSQTRRYIVPVVEVSHTVGDVLQALGADVSDVAISLPAPVEGRSLPPGNVALPSTAKDWGIEDDGGEAGPDQGASASGETPADGGAEPPSDLPSWLTELRWRFADDLIIKVADAVREELGRDVPITTIEAVARSEKAGVHTTIIDRLTKPKRSAGSTASTEASTEPSADDAASSHADPGGGQVGGPTSSAPGDRDTYVDLIEQAVSGGVSVRRRKVTVGRVLLAYNTLANKGGFDTIDEENEAKAFALLIKDGEAEALAAICADMNLEKVLEGVA